MFLSHVPNMCRTLDVHLHIKSLQHCAEVSITVLILYMRKLRLSEVKPVARFTEVVSGRADTPSQPVTATHPSSVGAHNTHLLPLHQKPLTREDSNLADHGVFSSLGQAPQPLAFTPKMASPEPPPSSCFLLMGFLLHFREQLWACCSLR